MDETQPGPDAVREWEPLEVAGGRTLAVCETGDPDGVVVLYLHGTGGSRLECAVLDAPARAQRVRVVSWDRPGAGRSPRRQGRRVLDVVGDARAVTTAAGASRAVVVGFSGGGCHVLALGAAAPDLVTAVVALNPGPPPDHASVGAMPAAQAFAIRSAARAPWLFRLLTRPNNARPSERTRQKRMRSLDPVDRAVLEDPATGAAFERSAVEGARQPSAWTDDALVIWGTPWGVDLAPYPVPLEVFSAASDGFTAFADALVADGARLHRFPGGHMAVLGEQVRADVVAAAARLGAG